ncbi:MAG: substrate-binding domain-containing protein [Actinomycetota bacterium]|nr:substrate-binding domain-containing protein [Actinomycetota bacterium]
MRHIRGGRARLRVGLVGVAGLVAVSVVGSAGVSSAGVRATAQRAVAQFPAPSKALCKKSHYKIGYDVFSGSQPFANLVTAGLVKAAQSIGCASIVKTIDNLNGPVAVGNLKTLVNEGIGGFVDFQVLAAYQPAIASELKSAKIPGVAIVGANLPGSPDVGASNYGAAYQDGLYMAQQAKKRFPGTVPYVLGGAEPSAGAIIMGRYYGAVAGEKKVYPNLPSSHVIEVQTDGTETTAYNNTLSALSAVPSGSVVLLTGVNDEVTGGMAKAAQTRNYSHALVNSFGGDPYGLSQTCNNSHYVGAWYLEPRLWGEDALVAIMEQMNGQKVQKQVGVLGEEVTHSTAWLHCK